MSSQRAFLVALAVLVAIGLAAGVLYRGPELVRPARAPGLAVQAQASAERMIFEPGWSLRVEVAAAQVGGTLGIPVDIVADRDGAFWVLDIGTRRVHAFDAAGEVRQAYGRDRGDEAALLAHPTDLSVDPGGDLWVADPAGRSVVRFAPDGEVRSSFSDPRLPMRIEVLANGGLLAMDSKPERSLLRLLDASGIELATGPRWLASGPDPLALDGTVAAGGDGGFYAGIHVGWLARITADGSVRWMVSTIDPVPLPQIEVDGDRRRVPADQPLATMGLAAAGDRIYCLTRRRDGVNVVDVYDTEGGAYIGSFVPPSPASALDVDPERLYLIGAEGVSVWQHDGTPLQPRLWPKHPEPEHPAGAG